jgi:hypothetical protein
MDPDYGTLVPILFALYNPPGLSSSPSRASVGPLCGTSKPHDPVKPIVARRGMGVKSLKLKPLKLLALIPRLKHVGLRA